MHAINRTLSERLQLSLLLPLCILYIAFQGVAFQILTIFDENLSLSNTTKTMYYLLALLFLLSYARTALTNPGRVSKYSQDQLNILPNTQSKLLLKQSSHTLGGCIGQQLRESLASKEGENEKSHNSRDYRIYGAEDDDLTAQPLINVSPLIRINSPFANHENHQRNSINTHSSQTRQDHNCSIETANNFEGLNTSNLPSPLPLPVIESELVRLNNYSDLSAESLRSNKNKLWLIRPQNKSNDSSLEIQELQVAPGPKFTGNGADMELVAKYGDSMEEIDFRQGYQVVEGRNYCERCHQFKPPRSHHCSQCDMCVLKMDHHSYR